MLRRVVLVVGALALAVVGAGTAAAANDDPMLISVNMRGTSANTSTNPTRQVFEFDLYSLETGKKIGTATDDIACKTDELPGCPLFDAITTFHLPDGDGTC